MQSVCCCTAAALLLTCSTASAAAPSWQWPWHPGFHQSYSKQSSDSSQVDWLQQSRTWQQLLEAYRYGGSQSLLEACASDRQHE